MNLSNETPQEAARRLSAGAISKGFKPEALHAYTDPNGTPLYYRIRLKHPETGEKWIRPLRRDGNGYKLGEPEFTDGKPLYRQHDLATRLDDPVEIVEGEWCADALTKIGALATSSGGADSAGKADWRLLAGRVIRIWPDNDEAGQRYALAVTEELLALGCTVFRVDVALLDLPPKGDVMDWLASNPNATMADIALIPTLGREETLRAEEGVNAAESTNNDDRGSQSQSSALVAFVEAHALLFHDQNSDVFAQDMGTRETRRLDGRQFRDWLVANFYQTTGKSPRDQSVREALSTLAGLGRFNGECRDVHVRVAKHEEAYFLDMAEAGQSRAIRIEAGRWEIIGDPPVRFVRPETLRPLPEPLRGGDLNVLWKIVNIPRHARLLVLAWLGECLRPDTPFPLLELIGEQGSAKSTTQTVLRRLIDPNACDLRAAPKAVEDIFVSAGANWLVSYENISHLSAPMQDALCVLATGGGFAKRKLYSDADESVIVVKRPVVLNGISVAVTAQDLIDRTLSVETPVILVREESTDLWRIFNAEHGRLLGSFLDVIAMALARLPDIHLPPAERPRLAEFARFGMAIAEAHGKTGADFMAQFNASRQESIARTIDSSPVAAALIDWFDSRNRLIASMPLKSLFMDIEKHRPHGTDTWPRSAKGFGDALRRAAPALRQMGIECRSLGKIGSYVSWEIKGREHLPNPCLASLEVVQMVDNEQDIKTCKTSPREFSTLTSTWEEF